MELEEFEHGGANCPSRSGSAGTDRYLQRVQTGGVGGLNLGKVRTTVESAINTAAFVRDDATERHARPADDGARAVKAPGSQLIFATSMKPNFVLATEMMINDIARSRVGDVLMPTEARVVDRP